eukprot:SAG11_NODE_3734_length_2258_cov_1.141732_2_plen_239_part_00
MHSWRCAVRVSDRVVWRRTSAVMLGRLLLGVGCSCAGAIGAPLGAGDWLGPGRGPWRVDKAENHGLDSAKLEAAAKETGLLAPERYCMLVIKDGVIIQETCVQRSVFHWAVKWVLDDLIAHTFARPAIGFAQVFRQHLRHAVRDGLARQDGNRCADWCALAASPADRFSARAHTRRCVQGCRWSKVCSTSKGPSPHMAPSQEQCSLGTAGAISSRTSLYARSSRRYRLVVGHRSRRAF